MIYTNALSVLALAGAAHAHMSMYYPAPLGGAPSINPQSTGKLDTTFNFPLGCCGEDGGDSLDSPGICRGHLDKYDTEHATVTWKPGQDAFFQLTAYSYDPSAPGGTHSGGSCQVGFSVDKGKTWKVAASYDGACPHATTDGSPEAQTFDFKVPTNMPEGDAIFGWIWLNREHEAFMNCAKVHISSGSGDDTPSQSEQPAPSSTQSEEPVYSETESVATSTPSSQPTDDGGYGQPPTTTTNGGNVVTVTTVVATTVYQTAEPTEMAVEAAEATTRSEGSDNPEDGETSEGSQANSNHWGQGRSQDEVRETLTGSQANSSHWGQGRPHDKVKRNTRRYQVDGSTCDCSRDELTLAARCSCDTTNANIERKALRLHRRTFYKRTDACDWNTAPAMETSYYTHDAKCAPNAKVKKPVSDDFELGWDVNCGVVSGISEYTIKTFSCDMYDGGY